MSYAPASVTAIRDRIGWSAPAAPAGFTLSEDNQKAESGRVFRAFHPLAVVENVVATMPISDAAGGSQIGDAALNTFLLEMKEQAAIKVLSRLFDQNPRADYATDYSDIVTSKVALFDNAYGYQVAFDVLQMMITSSRSNWRTAHATEIADWIIQMNGATDESGKLVLRGVVHNLNAATGALNDLLFPPPSKAPRIRDRSHLW